MADHGFARSYGAFLADKKRQIHEHLAEAPPTVVIKNGSGIYVFADNIAKVHSTIILAGAGVYFSSAADWFRGQITMLAMNWSPRDPAASSEIELLPRLFVPNTDASRDVVLADLVLVEIGKARKDDYVARVDAFGNITEYEENVVLVSYQREDDEEEESGEEENGGEADKADANTAPESRGNNEAEERERELRDEFTEIGIKLPAGICDWNGKTAELLAVIKTNYPGRAVMLKRAKVQKKEFDWVYRSLR